MSAKKELPWEYWPLYRKRAREALKKIFMDQIPVRFGYDMVTELALNLIASGHRPHPSLAHWRAVDLIRSKYGGSRGWWAAEINTDPLYRMKVNESGEEYEEAIVLADMSPSPEALVALKEKMSGKPLSYKRGRSPIGRGSRFKPG